MLTYFDSVWATACDRATRGQRREALVSLAPLLSENPNVPARLVLLAHRLAARIHMAAGRHGPARRHLRKAEALDPRSAEIQYELGVAHEDDPYGCDRRAAVRFKKALALGPGQAKYHAALGRALVRINRVRTGVRHLIAAADRTPANPAVLTVVVDGLSDAGKVRTTWRVVTRARFLAPNDPKIRRLWDQARYVVARASQKRARTNRVGTGPVCLPFVRLSLVGEGTRTGSGVIRRDAGSRVGPHFGRHRVNRSERG
jgi:predicted Zn-dependent protease